MRAILFTALLAALSANSSTAFAKKSPSSAEHNIALISLEISGDGSPELRSHLQKHIAKGLKGNKGKVISLDQTLRTLRTTPELIGCTSSTCLQQIGKLTSSRLFVRARVIANGANYEIELQLLSPSVENGVLKTITESCDVCTVSELSELVSSSAKQLIHPQDNVALQLVRIKTTPSGARVSIDGKEVGISPIETKLSVGLHKVSITVDGRVQEAHTIKVDAVGDVQPFALSLALSQSPVLGAGTSDGGEKEFGLLKWAAVAASGGFLIASAVNFSLDGERSHDDQIYETFGLGVGTLSAGVLLGAAAGWMFWQERNSPNAPSSALSLQLGSSQAIGSYQFQF